MHASKPADADGFARVPLDETLFTTDAGRRRLETAILPSYLQQARWFAGKARRPQAFSIAEIIPFGAVWLLVVEVRYAEGSRESYLVPLAFARHAAGDLPESAVAARDASEVLYDAVHSDEFRSRLVALIAQSQRLQTTTATLVGLAGRGMESLAADSASRVLAVEQSNSSIIYGERLFLKLYRKLESGMNPDAEMTRFLSEDRKFGHVPLFAGSLELHANDAQPRVLALATGLVANRGDAWSLALGEVERFYTRARNSPEADIGSLAGDYLERARLLGTRTGEMHAALAAPVENSAFGVAPMTTADLRELSQSIDKSLEETTTLIRSSENAVAAEPARALVGAKQCIAEFAARIARMDGDGLMKIRTHGDFHLGQVLDTGTDFVIIDFEGEPLRPLAWRKARRSPLRDVAGMLRSFEYAVYSGLAGRSPEERALLNPCARRWVEAVGDEFFRGWREAVRGTVLSGERKPDEARILLLGYVMEKALYEVVYELNHRPAWVGIPVAGVLALVETLARTSKVTSS